MPEGHNPPRCGARRAHSLMAALAAVAIVGPAMSCAPAAPATSTPTALNPVAAAVTPTVPAQATLSAAATQVVASAQSAATALAPTVQTARTAVSTAVSGAATQVAPTVAANRTANAQVQATSATVARQATATALAPTAQAVATMVAPTVQAAATQVVAAVGTLVAGSQMHVTNVTVGQTDTTVAIQNSGSSTMNLAGWTLVMGPSFSVELSDIPVPGGQTRLLHFSQGIDTDTDVYMGFGSNVASTSLQHGARVILIAPPNQIASVFSIG